MNEKIRFCMHCGAPLHGDGRFCGACGRELRGVGDIPTAGPAKTGQASAQKPDKRRKTINTARVIQAAVIAIAAIAVVFVAYSIGGSFLSSKSHSFHESILPEEGTSIWYHVKVVDSNYEFQSALVFGPDSRVRYYCAPVEEEEKPALLSSYADKDDIVILRDLRAEYLGHYYETMKNIRMEDIPDLNKEIDPLSNDFTEDDVEDISDDAEAFMNYCELTDTLACSYQLYAHDGKEVLAFNAETEPGIHNVRDDHEWMPPGISTQYFVLVEEMGFSLKFGKSTYKGFVLDGDENYLVTRCRKSDEFVLDPAETLRDDMSVSQIEEEMSAFRDADYELLKTHYDPADPEAEKPEMPKENEYYEGSGMKRFLRADDSPSDLY